MLKLYTYPLCPFCEKVRQAFAQMKVAYQEVNAERGTPGSQELIALGGKQQVPFLMNEEEKVSMYESNDIIAYAQRRFAEN